MSQQNDELPSFDYRAQESEHLIVDGAFRPCNTRSPTDRAVPAFPRPTTYPGLPTAPGFMPFTETYPPDINAIPDSFGGLPPSSNISYGSSGDSPAVSVQSSLPTYEYASQQQSPNPFMGSYPIQNAASSAMEFPPWINTDISGFGEAMVFNTGQMTLASPILAVSPMTATSESVFTDSDRPNIGELNSSMELDPSLQSPLDDPPRNKSSKVTFEQDVGSAQAPNRTLVAAESASRSSNSGGGSERGKSKLRSASRSSKYTSRRAGETAEERKTRNAHNLVEKQYRIRLNAQFEGLLNALPESIRTPNGVGAGGPSEPDPNVDLGERRLSKGDVLEMSTRYIKTLEKNCNILEREREELRRSIGRLQAMIAGQSSMQEEPYSGG